MNREVRLTRRYRFEAAHRLVSDQLSEAENQRIFGKCCRPGGHGHNYEVELTLSGFPDPMTGFLCPREELDRIVGEKLLDRVDHRSLNDVMPEVVTTGENLAEVFFRWLEPSFRDGPQLVGLGVRETKKNLFEVAVGGAS